MGGHGVGTCPGRGGRAHGNRVLREEGPSRAGVRVPALPSNTYPRVVEAVFVGDGSLLPALGSASLTAVAPIDLGTQVAAHPQESP